MPQARVLLDSNILLRWLEPGNPDQVIVAGALDRLLLNDAELCYTSQNLGEFWNTLTRPASRNGYGLTPVQADQRARAIESKITLLPDMPNVHIVWRKLLFTHSVSGVQVHDARLAAACKSTASNASLHSTPATSPVSLSSKPFIPSNSSKHTMPPKALVLLAPTARPRCHRLPLQKLLCPIHHSPIGMKGRG